MDRTEIAPPRIRVCWNCGASVYSYEYLSGDDDGWLCRECWFDEVLFDPESLGFSLEPISTRLRSDMWAAAFDEGREKEFYSSEMGMTEQLTNGLLYFLPSSGIDGRLVGFCPVEMPARVWLFSNGFRRSWRWQSHDPAK